MRVIKTTERLGEPCCAALGYFDGVHIGHAAVIEAAKKRANELGTELAVFTFYFEGERLPSKGGLDIFAAAERLNRLSRLGVDTVYMLPFSEIRSLTGERFVKKLLCETMRAKAVFTGPDFTFGCGGDCDAAELARLCGLSGIEATVCGEVTMDGLKVSSTAIKDLLLAGEIEKANRMLGFDYGFSLPVVEGDKRGRELGYATANQVLPAGVIAPKSGVYASKILIDKEVYNAITNIGHRPTFYADAAGLIETHIFYFDGDLYGQYLTLSLSRFLREEKKFDSAAQLSKQIEEDCAAAQAEHKTEK